MSDRLKSPWDNHCMAPAFWSFVEYARKELMEQFINEAGQLNLAAGPLGAAIDKATGRDKAEAQRFVDWCVTQFGTPEDLEGA